MSQAVTCKKLKKGETVKQFKGKVMHINKKDVNMLSTIYEGETEEVTVAGKEPLKPTVWIRSRYKKEHMAGVDLRDQITSCSSLVRKGVKKYYKKTAFRLFEMCIQNSHCIHQKNGGEKTFLKFKLQLIHDILKRHQNDVYWKTKLTAASLRVCPSRITGRHFPVVNTNSSGDAIKKQKRCRFCSLQKKTKRTIYSCDQCMVPLCVTPYFKQYHIVENLPETAAIDPDDK